MKKILLLISLLLCSCGNNSYSTRYNNVNYTYVRECVYTHIYYKDVKEWEVPTSSIQFLVAYYDKYENEEKIYNTFYIYNSKSTTQKYKIVEYVGFRNA